VHVKSYEPGALGAVKVAEPPAEMLPVLKTDPSVKVWATLSWLFTVIFSPGVTESVPLNEKFLMVMVGAPPPALLVDVLFAGGFELLLLEHPEMSAAMAMTTAVGAATVRTS